MRVYLAAQVLSKSVSDAFNYYGEHDTIETQNFVRTFDRFFDMLNTRSLEEGIYKRKPDLLAYRTIDDSRFEWLKSDLLGYIDGWKKMTDQRKGFTPAEKKIMFLPSETYEGLHVTVESFLEVGPFLLQQSGVKFLYSERFNQDPLEAFFDQQRARGGRNDNPTMQQFCDSTISLRIQKSAALEPLRGNCRRKTTSIIVDETPLPKRKRK